MKLIYSILIAMILLSATACNEFRTLDKGAENINLYSSYSTGNCKFLGVIHNPSVHKKMELVSSLEQLNKDDNNFLKNEAAKLGANVVILENHHSEQFSDRYVRGSRKSTIIYIHSITAKAYHCPSVKMNPSDLKIEQTPLFKNDDFKIRE